MRQQIQQAIWGQDTFVDFEQNLNFCIRQIRITLNDLAEKSLFIETLPRLAIVLLDPLRGPVIPEASVDSHYLSNVWQKSESLQ